MTIEIENTAALDAPGAHDGLAVEQHQDLPGINPLDLFSRGASGLGSAPGHDAGQLPQDFAHRFLTAALVDSSTRDHVHTRVEGVPQFCLARGGHHGDLRDDRRRSKRDHLVSGGDR
ncbi:MAG TPA: hypothetical protein VD833_21445 [Vicinamibacterales bacterium]|nr:hypothetical protein [Vicinamibacterales bacterium]